MALKKRAVAHLFKLYVGTEAAQLRSRWAHLRGRGDPNLRYFHHVADPYSFLTAQALWALLEDGTLSENALSVQLLPPPTEDAVPKPELARHYALLDAKRLGRREDLHFPSNYQLPDDEQVQRAERIILSSKSARSRLQSIRELSPDLFSGSEISLPSNAVSAEDAQRALQTSAREQRRAGHYLPATIHDGGEWYWGVDRLPHLLHALNKSPLVPALTHAQFGEPLSGPIECFFSFRSPYSYIAIERLFRASQLHDRLVLRPVLPMVMRGLAVPRIKRMYIVRDAAREARRSGIEFGFGVDPVGAGVERCLAVYFKAAEQGKGLRFAATAFSNIFSKAVDVSTDEGLRKVAERAGLSASVIQEALGDESWREKVEANRAALFEMGLWGVPCFRIGETTLWGQDRMPLLDPEL